MTTHPLHNYFLIKLSYFHIGEANRCIEIYPDIIVLKSGLKCAACYSLHAAEIKTLYFVFSCFAEDLLTLTSNKFRMVCKVDKNSPLDSGDWSRCSDLNLEWSVR